MGRDINDKDKSGNSSHKKSKRWTPLFFFEFFFASFSAQIGRIAKCGHRGFVFYTYLFSSIIQYTNFHQIRNGTSKPNNNRSKQSLKKSKYRKIMSTVLLWSLHHKLFFFFLMRCFLNSFSLYYFVIVTLSHFFFPFFWNMRKQLHNYFVFHKR